MDWPGRVTEREVNYNFCVAARFLRWIGVVERLNATERVVK